MYMNLIKILLPIFNLGNTFLRDLGAVPLICKHQERSLPYLPVSVGGRNLTTLSYLAQAVKLLPIMQMGQRLLFICVRSIGKHRSHTIPPMEALKDSPAFPFSRVHSLFPIAIVWNKVFLTCLAVSSAIFYIDTSADNGFTGKGEGALSAGD